MVVGLSVCLVGEKSLSKKAGLEEGYNVGKQGALDFRETRWKRLKRAWTVKGGEKRGVGVCVMDGRNLGGGRRWENAEYKGSELKRGQKGVLVGRSQNLPRDEVGGRVGRVRLKQGINGLGGECQPEWVSGLC